MTKRSLWFLVTLSLMLPATACKERGPSSEGHDDHGHEPKQPSDKAPEIPSLSVTLYQNGLELFMEYPAFVVGKPSALVAHFTDTRDPNAFKIVTKGRVTAVMRYAGGGEDRFVAEKLLRDGIFKPVVTPSKPGSATLTLILEGPQVAGTVEVGEVKVHPTVEATIAAAEPEESGAEATVAFLKEQQWKTHFATAVAEMRVLQGSVRANGEIKAVAGQLAELATPVAGLIPVGAPVPHLGQAVKKGDLLLSLSPTNIVSGTSVATVELEVSRARAERGLAARELKRAEELFAAKAIPEKQVDSARTGLEVATARLEAAERDRGSFRAAQPGSVSGSRRGGFELRSPLDGVISFAEVTPGAVVDAGTRLLAVVNTERLWLEAKVYETDVPRVETSSGASFTVAGFNREFIVDDKNGRRVAIGAVIDRATRTVPVIFEFANPGGLRPGMFAKVDLLTGETLRGVTVPQSAVLDDNGRAVVFVMADGENFHKRVVRPGVRAGGFVQMLEGIKEGDRVVTQGAYEIKLASAAGGIPEHGHQH
jgi:cobalt-zinc-cadmium efflux system membrane fusion protein